MKTFNESFEDINRLCETEHKPLLAMLGKLMEETGEAAECVLIHEGQITHKTMKEPLVGEIADVIQVAISILVKSTPDLSMEERQHLLLSHLERKNLKWENVQQGEESRQRALCARWDQVSQEITQDATGDHGRPLAPAGNIEQQIIKIIADHFDLSKRSITLEKHLVDDLGADSLDTIEICMAIEDEFDMEISDADAERCLTVEKIVNYVKGRYGFQDEADDIDDGALEAYSAPAKRAAEHFDPAAEYTERTGRHLSLNERMIERSIHGGRTATE